MPKINRREALSAMGFVLISGFTISNKAFSEPLISSKNDSPISLIATTDFENDTKHEKIWYIDTDRQSLAVDAARFKDQFASVKTKFSGSSGQYHIHLTALTETDGESQYQISIVNSSIEQSLPVATNPESLVDFKHHIHQWTNIQLEPGDTINVSFNSTSNGKIPEGDGTAYARGRWTKLELRCASVCD